MSACFPKESTLVLKFIKCRLTATTPCVSASGEATFTNSKHFAAQLKAHCSDHPCQHHDAGRQRDSPLAGELQAKRTNGRNTLKNRAWPYLSPVERKKSVGGNTHTNMPELLVRQRKRKPIWYLFAGPNSENTFQHISGSNRSPKHRSLDFP